MGFVSYRPREVQNSGEGVFCSELSWVGDRTSQYSGEDHLLAEGIGMKDAYYFSHDSNARQDPSILAMRSVYGSEGYGWYWILIEMLREQSEYRIKINKYVWNALAMQMQCTADAAQKFVEDCINEFDLFVSDGEFFWSESLLRRMTNKDEKSEKARQAALKRWAKPSSDKGIEVSHANAHADAMQTQCDSNAIKERKVKESKVKENKKDIIPFSEIIEYLNAKTGSNYRPGSKATQRHIQARWNEGFGLDDFRQVIDKKTIEWGDNPQMSQYLRPETLFGTKFESYLNQPLKPVLIKGGHSFAKNRTHGSFRGDSGLDQFVVN